MRLATIDLGTNTVRLLVVDAEGGGWRPVDQAQRVTRLGEGQAGRGALQPAPAARTLDTVAEFVRRAEALGAARVRIIATSAVREAANRAEFVARLEAAAGRAVEVLSGEEEARLTLLGVQSGLPALAGPFVLLDIGGGSTEFTLARGGRLERAVSLRLGVVAYAERPPSDGRFDAAALAGMRAEIAARLYREVPDAIAAAGARRLVGTAGTVTTLAALDLGLHAYDPARVQGHALARAAIEGLLDHLARLTHAERAALACLEPGRADVIVPGIAICLGAMERLGFDVLTVSDRGLREGILCEILAPRGDERPPSSPADARA
jgi:exopolyphosphatase / guanosine-5'-triphosphate,3'-diphosphate pyrophosphatase